MVAETGSTDKAGATGVSGRYASALFDLARDDNAIEAVGRDLDAFEDLLVESEDLRRLVKSPVFTGEEQSRAIGAVLDRAGITGLTASFIKFVAAQRRLFAIADMIRDFRSIVARHKGIVAAEVRLAEAASPRMMDEIRTQLRDMVGREVDVAVKIDPALIGGLIVKIGSRMVDASLKTKLNQIRLAMKEAR